MLDRLPPTLGRPAECRKSPAGLLGKQPCQYIGDSMSTQSIPQAGTTAGKKDDHVAEPPREGDLCRRQDNVYLRGLAKEIPPRGSLGQHLVKAVGGERRGSDERRQGARGGHTHYPAQMKALGSTIGEYPTHHATLGIAINPSNQTLGGYTRTSLDPGDRRET